MEASKLGRHVSKRADHTSIRFYRRTIAAQIHALGSLLMITGGVFLFPIAARLGTADLLASIAFIVTGFLVFTTSATYHFLSDGYLSSPELETLLEDLDHFSIYLFIAGTYTPFFVRAIADPWRWPLIIFIWTLAIFGIAYTSLKPRLPKFWQNRYFYTGIFVLMGWTLLIRIGEVVHRLSAHDLSLLIGGGLFYSVGAIIYSTKRPRLWAGVFGFHELWHIMVLGGAVLHYWLIYSILSAASA